MGELQQCISGGGRGAMDPAVWGASGWHVLHRLSFHTGTFDSIQSARVFFDALKYILPCDACRGNIKNHITNVPFPQSLALLAKWVYDIHNRVNKCRGVGPGPSFSDVQAKYKNNQGKIVAEEWRFIRSIAKAHPGKLKITTAYEHALTVFLRAWWGRIDFDVRSRRQFNAWIQMITSQY